MTLNSRWIFEKDDLLLVEDWFKELAAACERLLEEANCLVFTACDGVEITPNEKIRRLELLAACVRHNARLAARAEKLRAEHFQDRPELLEKYQSYTQLCERRLQEMPKSGF